MTDFFGPLIELTLDQLLMSQMLSKRLSCRRVRSPVVTCSLVSSAFEFYTHILARFFCLTSYMNLEQRTGRLNNIETIPEIVLYGVDCELKFIHLSVCAKVSKIV